MFPNLHNLPTFDTVGVQERVDRFYSRSIKNSAKIEGLKLALSMVDLTTLEGKDTKGKVQQLCYKAMHPHDVLQNIPSVAAICVYPTFVGVAKKALQGDPFYQDMYLMYDDRTMPDLFDQHVPEVLPDRFPGNFTYKKEIKKLDVKYSLYLSEKISEFILKNNIKKEAIICSHGHTVFHQPENGITLQIGNSIEIKNSLDNIIVCDFRVQDVKLGGQGAPLVPIGDKLLFSKYDSCLNLGGIANISASPLPIHKEKGIIAFDICPANMIFNHYAQLKGKKMDKNG